MTIDALPLEAWRETKDTVHLWSQVLGKVALACAPFQPHWWHVTLRVTPRGVATQRLAHAGVSFDLELDLLEHRLVLRTDRGERDGFALRDGLSVAAFHAGVTERLARAGVRPELRAVPFGVPMTTPFAEDSEHARYEPEWVERWWRTLLEAELVLRAFAGRFTGKASPVQLFWHSFDLAYTRFSGRRAPDVAGLDPVTRESYSHEVISFGFWAGDDELPMPAFYAYAAPEPNGLAAQPLAPKAASWGERSGGALAIYPHEAWRLEDEPRAALLAFLESTYAAGARAAGWDTEALASSRPRAAGIA